MTRSYVDGHELKVRLGAASADDAAVVTAYNRPKADVGELMICMKRLCLS